MTAEDLNNTQSVELNTQPKNLSIASDVLSTSSPTMAQEKLLKQSEVNEIVGRIKHESYEKGRADSKAEFEKFKQNENFGLPNQPMNQQSTLTQNADDIRKMVAEQIQQEQQRLYFHQQGENLANEIKKKLNDAKTRYPDFDDVVKEDSLTEIPEVLLLANQVDNAGDVIYDLFKNGSKLGNVTSNLMAAQIKRSPLHQQLAIQQIKEISNSIKANQQAVANQPKVNAPLSQITPSNVGVDTGKRSISDLRKLQAYRG